MISGPAPFDRPALLLSLAVHAFALLALASTRNPLAITLAREVADGEAQPIAIVHRAVPTAAPSAVPLRTPNAVAAMPVLPPKQRATPNVLRTMMPMPRVTAHVYALLTKSVAPTDLARVQSAPAQPAAGPAGMRVEVTSPDTPVPTATVVPTTAAAATATASTIAARAGSGPGVFGQNRKADLGSGVSLAELVTIAGGRFVARVTVDENGRALDVTFVVAPKNAEELKRRLLATQFVPAECDGMYCDGVVEVRG